MYDPTVGRWTTEDPIGFEGGDFNTYRFVGNDVPNATDPDGLWEIKRRKIGKTGYEEIFYVPGLLGRTFGKLDSDGIWIGTLDTKTNKVRRQDMFVDFDKVKEHCAAYGTSDTATEWTNWFKENRDGAGDAIEAMNRLSTADRPGGSSWNTFTVDTTSPTFDDRKKVAAQQSDFLARRYVDVATSVTPTKVAVPPGTGEVVGAAAGAGGWFSRSWQRTKGFFGRVFSRGGGKTPATGARLSPTQQAVFNEVKLIRGLDCERAAYEFQRRLPGGRKVSFGGRCDHHVWVHEGKVLDPTASQYLGRWPNTLLEREPGLEQAIRSGVFTPEQHATFMSRVSGEEITAASYLQR